jgi:hypothetical protein
MSTLSDDDISFRFSPRQETSSGFFATEPRHHRLDVEIRALADFLNRFLPEGRESEKALEGLEIVAMWAHKSVSTIAPLYENSQNPSLLND